MLSNQTSPFAKGLQRAFFFTPTLDLAMIYMLFPANQCCLVQALASMEVNMDGFLRVLTGSRAAEWALLHLFHYGETYGRAIAADFPVSLLSVQNQLDKLERAGVLVSKLSGRTRLYTWNPKSPFVKPMRDLVRIQYEGIPMESRQELFARRRRPRRKGKPVGGEKPT